MIPKDGINCRILYLRYILFIILNCFENLFNDVSEKTGVLPLLLNRRKIVISAKLYQRIL
jgi:hypothetical protein